MSHHAVCDVEDGKRIIKDMDFYFIELPKFNQPLASLVEVIDKWTYFIKHAEELTFIPDYANDDEGLKEAFVEADKHNWSKEELEAYDYVLMREQDDRGRITKVQKDIAKNFLNLGVSIEDTAKGTGLTLEQVRKLQSAN